MTTVTYGANGGEGGSSAPYTGGKGGGTQKEGWVRVPTIFSMPGSLPEGKQYDGQVANFDFYSTIAALAGQKFPEHCDGVDLIPYFRGEKKEAPTSICSGLTTSRAMPSVDI